MEILKNLTLVLHFVGLASLLGGFLLQMSGTTKRIDPAMFHGALTMLVTGLALVVLDQALEGEVNHTKVGVKLLVLVVVTTLVVLNRKKPTVPVWVWGAIGGLTLLNVTIAVFW